MTRNVLALAALCLLANLAAAPGVVRAEELVVSAAASLTDAFSDIEPAFEKAHPGVDVVMNFASSGALYRQIEQGAPADVYASANPKWMQKAVEAGFVAASKVHVFAQNVLVLAVPADNPAGLSSLDDLGAGKADSIGIGTPETVPAGQYAKAALEDRGMYAPLAPKMIFAESVRQVLDYLARGEVDCGFVYRTDAVKGGEAVMVLEEVPLDSPVTYPIAVLESSASPETAQTFVAFVRSEAGVALLQGRGFQKP